MTSRAQPQKSEFFGNSGVDLSSRTRTMPVISKPRTALTMTERKKEKPERVSDPAKMKKIILESLSKRSKFIPRKFKEITEEPSTITGVLSRNFKLSDIYELLGLSGSDDHLIFKVLDEIAKSGNVVFRKCGIYSGSKYWDVDFIVETAQAARSIGDIDISIKSFRNYVENPVTSAKEIATHKPLFDIPGIVKNIRTRRDKKIQESLGIIHMPSLTIEHKIAQEEATENEILYKKAIIKLAEMEK